MGIYDVFDISRTTVANFHYVFTLNNSWNLWWGGKRFFIRFRNSFPMLVFTFLLYDELIQMMFHFRCFFVVSFIYIFLYYVFAVRRVDSNDVLFSLFFCCPLYVCLHPDLSKAFWYGVTESLKISSEKDNDESRDSIESRSCLIIDGGWLWLDSIFMYCIWLFLFFVKGDKKNFQGWVIYIYQVNTSERYNINIQ